MRKTYLEPEERAYTARGSMVRKGRALFPDGVVRAVRAGVPDTYFSVPACARIRGCYVRGFVTYTSNLSPDAGEFQFIPYTQQRATRLVDGLARRAMLAYHG